MTIPNPGSHGFLIAEASDITGISNGSVITSWPDQLSAMTGLPRLNSSEFSPEYVTNTFGAAPGIKLTNSSNPGSQNVWVDWGSASVLTTQGSLPSYTAIVVVKTSDVVPDATGDWVLIQGNIGSGGGIALGISNATIYPSAPDGAAMNFNNSNGNPQTICYSPNAQDDGNAHILTYVYDHTAGTQILKVDGAIVSVVSGTTPFSLNNGEHLITGPGQAGTSNCVIGAVYFGTAALDSTDIHTIENYLSSTYSITTFPDDNLEVTSYDRFNIGHTQARIAWLVATGGAASITYSVYRSTSNGFTPGSGNLITSGLSGLNYLDTGLSAGTTYYYQVEATDGFTTVSYGQTSLTTVAADGYSIVYLGDSTTDNYYPEGAPYYCSAALTTASIANGWNSQGKGGAGTPSYLSNFLAGCISASQDCQADVFSLGFGPGDAYGGTSVSTYITDFNGIVAGLIAAFPSAIIIVQGTPYNTTDQGVLAAQYDTAELAVLDGVVVRQGNFSELAYFQANQGQLADGLHPSNPTGATNLGDLWAVGKSGYDNGSILSALTVSQGYTVSGPSSIIAGEQSSSYTVTVPSGTSVSSPVTITPSATGCTFSPTSVTLTGSTPGTFTILATTAGTVSVSFTNSGSLINPVALSITVSPPLAAPVLAPLFAANGCLIALASAATGGTDSYTYGLNYGNAQGGESSTGVTSPYPVFAIPLADIAGAPAYITITVTDYNSNTQTSNEESLVIPASSDPTWADPLSLVLSGAQSRFSLVVGDRLPALQFSILDASGSAIDESLIASVTAVVRDAQANTVAGGTCSALGPGYVYEWQSGETNNAGEFYLIASIMTIDGRTATVSGSGTPTVIQVIG